MDYRIEWLTGKVSRLWANTTDHTGSVLHQN